MAGSGSRAEAGRARFAGARVVQGATAGELRVALVVGDVMGTSMTSAAITGRLRVAARALSKTALQSAELPEHRLAV